MVDIHHTGDGYWWQSTDDTWRMAKDRSLDRHALPARIIRPNPPELWERLGEVVGTRRRSEVISDLIRRFLEGEPMPARPGEQ